MESVSSRSISRAPIKIAVTVTGMSTTGMRDEAEPEVRKQVVEGNAGEVAVGQTADGLSGGSTSVQGSRKSSKGTGGRNNSSRQ